MLMALAGTGWLHHESHLIARIQVLSMNKLDLNNLNIK
jgi:hypothetical protein